MAVKHRASSCDFLVTMVYGLNDPKRRVELWNQLTEIAKISKDPWLISGDFNNILNWEDRIRSPCTFDEVKDFRECLSKNDLVDFKVGGLYYTWNNKQEGQHIVCSKIDRVLVNNDWLSKFDKATAVFLPERTMDYYPCVMNIFGLNERFVKPFKIFNHWTSAPGFFMLVQQHWNIQVTGTAMYRVVKKLQAVKKAIKAQNLCSLSSVETADLEASSRLMSVQKQLNLNPCNENLISEERQAKILKRRIQNRICSVTQNDQVVQDPNEVVGAFVGYYQNLLGDSYSPERSVHATIIEEGKVLNQDQKDMLCCPFSETNVKAALWSIEDDKALGPDGFSSFLKLLGTL
ncbi:uncharacterized protein LOC110728681 [Chenopodium quinoa]|uniref:uncharacterized protein LOC110728681 n=1 Tax=Chenopodium quinoa TaxID=63459 RepID=UPI000B793788|nr:uncharacterized protein LOC110728681 [Chenopodium quinoa]